MIALLKPGILWLSVLMAALGIWLAPGTIGVVQAFFMLVGTGLIVGSANALNMVMEIDVDARMKRTKDRPLPAGRMSLKTAVLVGIGTGFVATAILYLSSNLLTALLGYGALVSYVLIYTPLKRKTPQALLVGAVPGAMPPLMGWTAVTGGIEAPGLVLFGILLLWQLPHFIAIAVYRKHDYETAGFKTVPVVRGNRIAKWQTVAYATLLIPLSIALTPLGAAGTVYGIGACAVSVWFLVRCLQGFVSLTPARWGRRVFLASLIYLPALGGFLLVDRLLG
jgi:protoheme IX farnesyltransferase